MRRAVDFALEHYLTLPLGGLIAVVWANTYSVSYFRTAEALTFLVNDVGMAVVLAYLMQEVLEAALPGGSLHGWRRTIVPIVAAAGGVAGAVATYAGYISAGDEEVLARGWPIAIGVDVLLCVAIARSIFRRTAAVTFALSIALASDAVGLAIISRRDFATREHPEAVALLAAAVVAAALFRKSRVRSLWPYLGVSGVLSWIACYDGGLHPALALLPIVPFMAHAPRNLNADRERSSVHAPANHLERVFRFPVQAIAFFVGLVNAGISIRGYGTGTWAVAAAALLGRPIGMLIGTGIALAVGLHLPRGVRGTDVAMCAVAASPSATFGLFMAAAVFPSGPLLIETRIGSLLTMVAWPAALAVAYLLRAGRFGDAFAGRA